MRRGCPRQPRIRRDGVRATIPYSGRRSSEASGATLHQRRCQAAHVSSRPPLPRPHRASSARRVWPDPSIRVRRCCAGPYTSRHVVVGVSRQAGFSSIPCGTAPSWRYRQSAIRSSYEDRCVKPVLLSAGRHRPVPPRVGICGCRGGAPHGEGALANLVSGGMASPPRSLIRVRGAPRRAAPLYVIGAVGQPTSHHGHRSLGPTGPAPPGGSGPIRRSAFAGAPPACPPPAVPL